MKYLLFIGLLFLVCPNSFAEEFGSKKTVHASISGAHIPSGFDGNPTYVVVKGMFPSGCYSYKGIEMNHKTDFQHEVHVLAEVTNTICTMAFVPYVTEVSLGDFKVGEHTIQFASGDGTYFEEKVVIE